MQLTGTVAPEVKKDCLDRLNELQDATSHRKNESLVGNVQDVLVEGPNRKHREVLTARTRTKGRGGGEPLRPGDRYSGADVLHGHLRRVERGA